MKTLLMRSSEGYPIYIGHSLLETYLLKDCCNALDKRLVIITDSHLVDSLGKNVQQKLQQQGLPAELISFPAGEAYKTRETKQQLEDRLLSKHCGRDTCLIALGGGVVTDMVGFLGATYCRGIPVIYIPTTLLAMVDASIGGKTGVNTPQGKNLIGAFAHPHAVFMDTHLLRTLPQREWRNGLVEVIKHSLIADAALFEILQKNSKKILQYDSDFLIDIIYTSCMIKKNIVERDEREQGLRQLLNFGHTIGHAIETLENYTISHGEAVAIGLLVESYLSVQYGYLSENSLSVITTLLRDYGLPLKTSAFKNKDIFCNLLALDKKSLKQVAHCVLLEAIGKPHQEQYRYTVPVDPVYLNQALEWAEENMV